MQIAFETEELRDLCLKADVAEADRLDNKIYTMMAQNCGKKDDYFKKIVHKKGHADWFLDAEECKKHSIEFLSSDFCKFDNNVRNLKKLLFS